MGWVSGPLRQWGAGNRGGETFAGEVLVGAGQLVQPGPAEAPPSSEGCCQFVTVDQLAERQTDWQCPVEGARERPGGPVVCQQHWHTGDSRHLDEVGVEGRLHCLSPTCA